MYISYYFICSSFIHYKALILSRVLKKNKISFLYRGVVLNQTFYIVKQSYTAKTDRIQLYTGLFVLIKGTGARDGFLLSPS
jgi:hypothetical protein